MRVQHGGLPWPRLLAPGVRPSHFCDLRLVVMVVVAGLWVCGADDPVGVVHPPVFLPITIDANASMADCVVVRDLDADGDLDVVGSSRNDNSVRWCVVGYVSVGRTVGGLGMRPTPPSQTHGHTHAPAPLPQLGGLLPPPS
jgi:hypothetical protein